MGTFLGNLTVLGSDVETVRAILPGTMVGQWSERFVTVLHESYGMGTVDRPARKLSKALPQAAVLSAALVDSDLLELTVWQDGKRVTTRGHFPYDGTPKRGDPKKFCAALRLPEEDIFRLKAVWAKGDAEEQLELTADLLGTPLYCDTQAPPEREYHRDAARVDAWLAQRPDPPKAKNQTRAEIVQEVLTGWELNWVFGYNRIFYGGPCQGEKFCHWNDQGELVPIHSFVPEAWLADNFQYGVNYITLSPQRMIAEGYEMVEGGEGSWRGEGRGIVADSAGLLPCPMELQLDGCTRDVGWMWEMPEGGMLILYSPLMRWGEGPGTGPDLVRYASDGSILWRRSYDINDNWAPIFFRDGLLWRSDEGEGFTPDRSALLGYHAIDLDGQIARRLTVPQCQADDCYAVSQTMLKEQPVADEIWLTRRMIDKKGRSDKSTLLRFDADGGFLGEYPLPAEMCDRCGDGKVVLLPDRVCFGQFDEGIWVLDRKDFSVRAKIEDHRSYIALAVDGVGRIWAGVNDSTWEAYDQDLNLLSRHRLKGHTAVKGSMVDSEGHLRVLTIDRKNQTLRVYAMKEK